MSAARLEEEHEFTGVLAIAVYKKRPKIKQFLTGDFDFLHNFAGFVVDFDVDVNRLSVVIDLDRTPGSLVKQPLCR